MEKFGKRLRELREEKGLGQKELGNVLDTSKQNVSKWERGVNEPDQDTLIKLANFFDVTVGQLLGTEELT